MNYQTSRYDCSDAAKLRFFIKSFPFAVLVPVGSGTATSYLPLAEVPEQDKFEVFPRLFGHLDNHNPLLDRLEGSTAKAIFIGPNGYISPSDYISSHYPTWNYSCAEIAGTISLLHQDSDKRSLMLAQIEGLDHAGAGVVDTTSKTFASMLAGITFFTIDVTSAVGRFKFSQEKSLADRFKAAYQLQHKISQRIEDSFTVLADLPNSLPETQNAFRSGT